jgi:hypothetical protein
VITTKGRELAKTLDPLVGSVGEIDLMLLCSSICRLATTHHRLAEDECNIEMSEERAKQHDKQVERVETSIIRLVEKLPETDDGPLVAHFQGDPRGCTVKLLIDGLEQHPSYNGWALEAIIVPQ